MNRPRNFGLLALLLFVETHLSYFWKHIGLREAINGKNPVKVGIVPTRGGRVWLGFRRLAVQT